MPVQAALWSDEEKAIIRQSLEGSAYLEDALEMAIPLLPSRSKNAISTKLAIENRISPNPLVRGKGKSIFSKKKEPTSSLEVLPLSVMKLTDNAFKIADKNLFVSDKHPNPIHFSELRYDTCSFPLWQERVKYENMYYCGNKIEEGDRYCKACQAIVYVKL